jgi:hypothetical protein
MVMAVSNPSRLINTKPIDRVTLIANPGTEAAEAFTVLLNPTRLMETIQVEWARLPVIGLDHEVVQYTRTRSINVPMSFYFSIFESARQNNLPDVDPAQAIKIAVSTGAIPLTKLLSESMDFANFLRSLCFPTRTGLRPPTVKVIWPNVFSFLAVVDNLHFEYMKFDKSLTPITYQADVNFLEVRLTRRYSESVRVSGLVADGEDVPE